MAFRRFVAIGALALLCGPPAAAIDVASGTWEGKMTCRQVAGGVAAKTKQDVTITIGEDMGDVGVDVHAGMTPIATAIGGFLAEDGAKPNKAKLVGVECGLSWNQQSGATIHADVTIPPGSPKGTLKGTLTLMDIATTTAMQCSFSAKRTSTVVGMLSPCF
jgi:hypothetical protein